MKPCKPILRPVCGLVFTLFVLAASLAAAEPAPAGSPVARWGQLSVIGRQVCSAQGQPVQLRGMSLFWSQWGGRFFNKGAVAHTVKEWQATVVRAAMGVEMGGYLEQPEQEKKKVNAVIDAARELGIYVIVDWHDHNASSNADAAEAFFSDMARTYRDVPNLIWEVYNEPLKDESWESVTDYASRIAGAIRAQGAGQLILVGSPAWDQRLDLVARDPLTGFDNLAYTMHFYAASHGDKLRHATRQALDANLAVFCSEFGTCDASGNSRFSPKDTTTWLDFLDREGISWCNWALNDKDETASALKPRARATGGWTDANLTDSGKLIRDRLLKGDPDLSHLVPRAD